MAIIKKIKEGAENILQEEENLEQYRKRLERDPRFQYGTILNYVSSINNLLDNYSHNPTIEHLNEFIKIKCDKRQPWVKNAIKEYLFMIGREGDYVKLVQAKIKKPIKPKIFLLKDKLLQVMDSIKKEPYATIAKIQVATSARASAIIRIERKKIRKDEQEIIITLREKGEKPTVVYLRPELWHLIDPYYNKGNKYLFLEKEAAEYDERHLTIRINTMYKRYLEKLKEAAKSFGINMINLIFELIELELVFSTVALKI